MSAAWFARSIMPELKYVRWGLAALTLVAPVIVSSAPLKVVVSIPPQVAAVRGVGGADVEIEVLVQPGQAPETFEPGARQLARMKGAQLYVTAGMPFEKSLREKLVVLFPGIRVVDGTAGLDLEAMDGAACTGHSHVGHAHAGADPHWWLDPLRVVIHARLIAVAISELDSSRAAEVASGVRRFELEQEALVRSLEPILQPCRGRSILVAHPAFGYLARRFEITQLAVEHDGKEPSARQLAQLIERVRAAEVGAVFVQAQFPSKGAEVVAGNLRLPVVMLDHLSVDYARNLEVMAREIAASCRRVARQADAPAR